MAEFTVTISELSNASGKYKNQAEAFRSTANALLQATSDLTAAGSGWDDDASKVFAEKIGELKSWCDSMGAIVDTYAGALNTIGEKYVEVDQTAASKFKS